MEYVDCKKLEPKCQRLRLGRHPINTSSVPFQDPELNHVAANRCGVVMEVGDDGVEFFFGVLGVGG